MSVGNAYSTDNYIKYSVKYSDSIDMNIGSWLSLKSSELSIGFDILNNIKLISYNCDYGVHTPLSLLSLMFNPSLILQSCDRVIDSFKLKCASEFEHGENDTVVRTKKELWEAVKKNKKLIYVENPNKIKKGKNKRIEDCKYIMSMEEYLSKTLRRVLHIMCIRKYREVINVF